MLNEFLFNEELSTKLQGLRADLPKEEKAKLVRDCIVMLRNHQRELEPVVPPIDKLEDFDRAYIPLPGGWEIQTKGKGSSFRICDTKTGDRLNIPHQPYLFEMLEKMGREIHSAWSDIEAQAPSPVGEGQDWRAIVQRVQSTLDDFLGDTDPDLPDDMTDEEVRDESPIFWCCQQLSALLAAQAPKPASGGSEPLSGNSPLRDALQTMVASAQVYAEGNEITGYRIKTGALHRVIGMLGLTVPSNLPLAALHANYGGFTQKSLDDARDFPLIAAEADTAKDEQMFSVVMNGQRFDGQPRHMTAMQIRQLVHGPLEYQLFKEMPPDTPDEAVSNFDLIDLAGPIQSFYACPPATYSGHPPAADRLAQTVTDAEVEALRESLWSTWGKDRQTTDWPSRAQLAAGLKAALRARESAPAQEPPK